MLTVWAECDEVVPAHVCVVPGQLPGGLVGRHVSIPAHQLVQEGRHLRSRHLAGKQGAQTDRRIE